MLSPQLLCMHFFAEQSTFGKIGSVAGYFIKTDGDHIRMKPVIIQTYLYMIGKGFVLPVLDGFFKDISRIRLFSAFCTEDNCYAYDMYYHKLEHRASAAIDPAEMLLVCRVATTPHLFSMPDSDRVLA